MNRENVLPVARPVWFLALAILFLVPSLEAATYHVDAQNGSDVSGNGSGQDPYRSLSSVFNLLQPGDEVILYDGNYGSIRYANRTSDIFTDWVEFKAAEGSIPELDSIVIHANDRGVRDSGSFDAYIRISGMHVLGRGTSQSVALVGARHVEIANCLIEVEGPWTGSEANIEKAGFYLRGGTDIVLRDSEITRVGVGVAALGYDVRILNNHIHDITHDGIRSTGLVDSLVEGNLIHGLDDGVEDTEASWSKHCDGIHIFISGSNSADSLIPNHNVIFRGNTIYDIEAQGIQFNNYGPFPEVHNSEILFENNIFGPVHAVFAFNDAEIVDGLVLRNNTFLEIEGGTTYVSPYNETMRTLVCSSQGIRITPNSTGVEVYNNILPYGWGWPIDDYVVWDSNVILNPLVTGDALGGPKTLAVFDEQFLNPSLMNGVLLSSSAAIDNADTQYPFYPYDIYGYPRDNSPDIGAYEFGGIDEWAPVLGSIGNQTLTAGESKVVRVKASDLDGDPITLSPGGLPAFVSFTDLGNGLGELHINPLTGDEGSYEGITVTASDGGAEVSIGFKITVKPVEVSTLKLVGRWTMDDSAAEVGGTGLDGVLNANASFVTDAAEGSHALSLTGGNDSLVVADAEPLQLSGDASFAFYVKQSTFGGNILSKSFNDGYRIRVLDDGVVQMILAFPESGPHTVIGAKSPFKLPPGEWHHIAITVDFSDSICVISFYLDLVLQGTQTLQISGIETGAGALAIGAGNELGLEPFVGLLDDVRIYSGALDEAQVASLYAETWAGYPVDPDNSIDTGDWLGLLFRYGDSDWMYSGETGSLLFIPEPEEPATGAWVFFLN